MAVIALPKAPSLSSALLAGLDVHDFSTVIKRIGLLILVIAALRTPVSLPTVPDRVSV